MPKSVYSDQSSETLSSARPAIAGSDNRPVGRFDKSRGRWISTTGMDLRRSARFVPPHWAQLAVGTKHDHAVGRLTRLPQGVRLHPDLRSYIPIKGLFAVLKALLGLPANSSTRSVQPGSSSPALVPRWVAIRASSGVVKGHVGPQFRMTLKTSCQLSARKAVPAGLGKLARGLLTGLDQEVAGLLKRLDLGFSKALPSCDIAHYSHL